jgi:outer membrane receptor protein involved in Fe transport
MKRVPAFVLSFLLLAATAYAGVTGSISGTVSDPSGGVVVGASVVALNVDTGVKSTTQTNGQGFYSFPNLPIGRYSVQIQATGFAEFQVTNLIVDVNNALRVDATLKMGAITEVVSISATVAQVETQSTQMGELIGRKEMVTLPLDGRDWTELMALQPGVAPDVSLGLVAGDYSPGTSEGQRSISGGRESANGFMVNGANVEEPMYNGVSVIPNLDSIAEFRILTNNFDAEYGHYSGGMVNLVTKSGANDFHGDAFEFLRLTGLNARNYYNPASTGPKSKYLQNQFGGTFGGPIKKDKLFFFADYEGTRRTTGGTSLTTVPSNLDRQGNLLDQADSLTGAVQGGDIASTLSARLTPQVVSEGEPFYYTAAEINPVTQNPYGSNCATSNYDPTTGFGCVFPNASIPKVAFDPVAANLLQYIPAPTVTCPDGSPCYSNPGSASNAHSRDDKGGIRADAYTRWGMASGYYHIDDYYNASPDAFSVGAIGSYAGFGRTQLVALGDTKDLGNSSLNEFRMSYTRSAADSGAPTSAPIDPASVQFTVGCNTLGICPVGPFLSIPQINLNTFNFGWPESEFVNRENTYQVFDNFTKILGTHSLKFGGIGTLFQINMQSYYGNNGIYYFDGTAETGLDFADFLLGAVYGSGFNQGQQLALHNLGWYYGLFAQDSWRVRKNLTLNYGLRWDVTVPWVEKDNRMEALVPGVQSATFPTAPVGWTVPGDPGVPRTVSPIRYGNFAPRLGLAYSPDPKGGFWQKLTGGAGATSIRAGWGMFYTSLENWINGNGNGDAPYGYYYVNPNPSEFGTPYVDLYTGNVEGQRFPVSSSIISASPSHPDPNVPWATQFVPISSSPTYYYKNVVPYTESYMLSVQRALRGDTILNVSYVGTQGHHLMVIFEANPSNPALCLEAISAGCGPGAETGTFTLGSGQVIMPRDQLGPNGGVNFGSTGWFRTMGHSSYNALEVSMRHTTGRLTLLGGYTYSKSMDNSSAPGDQVYPFNPNLSTALSAWDATHNFVVSYSYELPLDRAFGANRLSRGWIVSGITRFATGTPITILETDDYSLTGNTSVGPSGSQDEPFYTPGKLLLDTNPRKGGTYFNTSLFILEGCQFLSAGTPCTDANRLYGYFGNSRRRFFHGPGWNNWDIALLKDLRITESKALEFRVELFNAFNHAQFNNPDGNILDSTFGVIQSARDARIGQLALKFTF